jgi:hypothetical protein
MNECEGGLPADRSCKQHKKNINDD